MYFEVNCNTNGKLYYRYDEVIPHCPIIVPSLFHRCSIVATGPSASGVPGEVSGYRTAWKKYGRLPWKELVQPAIDFAKKGFRFGYAAHAAASGSSLKWIKNDTGLR